MRTKPFTRGLILLIVVSMLLAMVGCGCAKAKKAEAKLYGTWYYVNGQGQRTKVYISFDEEGNMKLGTEGAIASVISQNEWNQLLSSLFGNVSELIQKTGINLDISAVDLSETLSGLLSMSYDVKNEEEIRFTVTALKLVKVSHTSQYNIKKNGDLVLNGMVFRKK